MNFKFTLVLAVLIIAPSAGMTWHVNTHLQMTRDAISLMPPEFKKSFTEHQKYVETGIKDPDEILKDWQNHYYLPGTNPEGGAIDRIEKLTQVIQNKFQNSSTIDVSKQLCHLAHYIGDLWSPETLIKQNTASDAMFVNDNDIVIFYEGFREPITDFREYFQRRSDWRWRLENSKTISTLLYNEAVNDIARSWLTLWQRSGQKVDPQPTALIQHKKGTLSVNYDRLLLEETVSWNQWYVSAQDPIDKTKSHFDEIARLNEEVNPSDNALAARAMLRNEQALLAKANPEAPFAILETSLKKLGENSILIGRVHNRSNSEIPAISFMYPGVKGAVALIENLKSNAVAKIEAKLPADATKENIQIIFATHQQ